MSSSLPGWLQSGGRGRLVNRRRLLVVVSVVSPEVPGDHVPPAGAVGTGGALVGLLPGVGPLVGGEMVRPAEHLQKQSYRHDKLISQ